MILIFVELCPPFVLIYDGIRTDTEFWDVLYRIISKITKSFLSHPRVDFPAFLTALYSIKESLPPKDAALATTILECLPLSKTPHFTLWKYPETLGNVSLYLEIFYHLRKNHLIWNSITSSVGASDQIYDRFISQFDSLAQKPSCGAIYVAEMVTTLLIEKHRIMTNSKDKIHKLWSKLLVYVSSSDGTFCLCGVRCTVALSPLVARYLSSSVQKELVLSYFESLLASSFMTVLGYRQFVAMGVLKVPYSLVLKKIMASSHYLPERLQLMSEILHENTVQKPLEYIGYIFDLAMGSDIWFKTAVEASKQISEKYYENKEVSAWLHKYFRNISLFIGISKSLNKYRVKSNNLIWMLMEFSQSVHTEMSTFVDGLLYTLEKTGKITSGFSSGSVFDVALSSDIEKGIRAKRSIKNLLEVDFSTDDFVPPVSARSASAKASPSKSKTRTQGTITKPKLPPSSMANKLQKGEKASYRSRVFTKSPSMTSTRPPRSVRGV